MAKFNPPKEIYGDDLRDFDQLNNESLLYNWTKSYIKTEKNKKNQSMAEFDPNKITEWINGISSAAGQAANIANEAGNVAGSFKQGYNNPDGGGIDLDLNADKSLFILVAIAGAIVIAAVLLNKRKK